MSDERAAETGTSVGEELTAEFDTVAAWTEEAVRALGPQYALPAACRGSGSPSALAWLAEALGVGDGDLFLDAGAGVGGPAAWLRERYRARVVAAEPMPAATAASHRLFGLPAVTAWSQSLPLRDGCASAAWCLGVLDTTPDAASKRALLEELRRVLRPGGALGILVLVREADELHDPPSGNDFPTHEGLVDRLSEAGFTILQKVATGSLAGTPLDWQARADRVDAELERRHGGEPGWQESQRQGERMGRVLGGGEVASWLVHAVALA